VSVCVCKITRLCAEEAAAQEQMGQVEECLKNNLLKIKQEECKTVQNTNSNMLHLIHTGFLCNSCYGNTISVFEPTSAFFISRDSHTRQIGCCFIDV